MYLVFTQFGDDLLKGTEKMKINSMMIFLLTAFVMCSIAQSFETADTAVGNSPASKLDEVTSTPVFTQDAGAIGQSGSFSAEGSGTENKRASIEYNTTQTAPVATADNDDSDVSKDLKGSKDKLSSKFTFNATVDMQAEREMYDVFVRYEQKRKWNAGLSQPYRRAADDFWMRVALRGMYRSKYFESAFALRFYPYWTMRRGGVFETQGPDLEYMLDVLEINEAYLKTFKEYAVNDNLFTLHFKIGRDGLLSTGSQLFGNYLELPTAGYGLTRTSNVVGPFKNRKVFANQIEVGFNFKISDIISGKTSLMYGGNVNNRQWYLEPTPSISEEMDSKLSAGFTRGYQDIYLLKDRIRLGGGFRVYTTRTDGTKDVVVSDSNGVPTDTITNDITDDAKFINGDWIFEFTFLPGLKFYSEFGYQKLGVKSTTGIVRPFTAGITIPTCGVLDVLALEVENVANTFFSDKSLRDEVTNRGKTNSFGWGIVIDKWLLKERVNVAWGIYSASPFGDMKTAFRLTSNLK
jgi:hypothetical protein